MKFSLAQEKAIQHGEGPALVIAGPGSGKTSVLLNRLLYLIEEGIDAKYILITTFSKAAARQMQERFQNMTKSAHCGVTFSTIHSLAYKVLNKTHTGKYNIISEVEREKLIASFIESKEIDLSKRLIKDFKLELTNFKSKGRYLLSYNPLYLEEALFIDFIKYYEEGLKRRKFIDLDDLLYLAKEIKEKGEDNIPFYQYLMIDEFQDTSKLQIDFLKLLVKENNIYAVGDDDQSIYSFRGAESSIFSDFSKNFPNHKIYFLSDNYRSAKRIVNLANKSIAFNKNRIKKVGKSKISDRGEVAFKSFESDYEQAAFIIKDIKQVACNESIAILARSNILLEPIRYVFESNNISFNGKEVSILEDTIFNKLLSYFYAAMGLGVKEDFKNILQISFKNIPTWILTEERTSLKEIATYYQINSYIKEDCNKLFSSLKAISNMSPLVALTYIRNVLAFDKFYLYGEGASYIEKEAYIIKIERIKDLLSVFEDIASLLSYINEDVKNESYSSLKQKSNVANKLLRRKKKTSFDIHLMTMHASKGLEFDRVYIINVNKGIIPILKAESKEALEEERRLFYVAITRAKKALTITYIDKNNTKKIEKSPFLEEININKKTF